jgi:hypothetical protein
MKKTFTLLLSVLALMATGQAVQSLDIIPSDTVNSSYLEVSDSFQLYRWYESVNPDSITYKKSHAWASQEGFLFLMVKSSGGQWYSDTAYVVPNSLNFSEMSLGRFQLDLSFLPAAAVYKVEVRDANDSLVYSRARNQNQHPMLLESGNYRIRMAFRKSGSNWTRFSPYYEQLVCIDLTNRITIRNVDSCSLTANNGGFYKPSFPSMKNYQVDYLWSNGSTSRGAKLNAGNHWVRITVNGLCTFFDSVEVKEVNVPSVCVDYAMKNNPCSLPYSYFDSGWGYRSGNHTWKFYQTHDIDNMLVSWDSLSNVFRYEVYFENRLGEDTTFLLGGHRTDYRFRFDRADWSAFSDGRDCVVRIRAVIDTGSVRDTTGWSCYKVFRAEYTTGQDPCSYRSGNSYYDYESNPNSWYFDPYSNYEEPIVPGCSISRTRLGKTTIEETSTIPRIHIKVYPNPLTDVLKVESPIGSNLMIYDVNGRLLLSENQIGEITEIDLQWLPDGLYMIRVQTGDSISSQRIIKQ